MKSYKELIVWQKSMELAKEVYRVSEKLPQKEVYGLMSQIRRAAISIPSNIAEGYARKHKQEYIQFLRVAFGSGAELETQLMLIEELGLVSASELEKANAILEEVMKMLNKLISSLVAKP